MWAASPARKSRPYCMGSTTKLCILATFFCRTGPSTQFPAFLGRQADLKLLPDFLVGPQAKILVRGALDIEAADLRRAHAEQREAALMIGVDQFLRRWRRLGENAQPSEGIIPLVNRERARRNRRAADAVKAVAAGDEITDQLGLLAFILEKNARPRRLEIVHADVFGFKK